VDRDAASFTDNQFHSLSIGLQRIADRLGPLALQVAELRRQGRTPDEILQGNDDFAPLGRFVVTLAPVDLGAFRTPTLRNVARTAPYMHDGSVPTLEEAVDNEVYYRSSERGRPLLLTPRERADLVAFLQSLTSPQDEVLAHAPASARVPAGAASGPGHAL
jgi:cytochrome c peroxidase